MNIYSFLANSVEITIFIVLIVGVVFYKRFSVEVKYIFYFVLIGGFFEKFSDFYKANIAKNTMPIGHLYFTLSIVLLCFFYLRMLKGFSKKWLKHGLLGIFLTYAIVNPLWIQSVMLFPNYLGAVGALILVIYSILFFSRILTETKIEKLSREPMLWINTAILFFYAGSFFYFVLFNLNVEKSLNFMILTARLYAILNILLYLSLGVAFLLEGKKSNLTSH